MVMGEVKDPFFCFYLRLILNRNQNKPKRKRGRAKGLVCGVFNRGTILTDVNLNLKINGAKAKSENKQNWRELRTRVVEGIFCARSLH